MFILQFQSVGKQDLLMLHVSKIGRCKRFLPKKFKLVMGYMEAAEEKFETGAEKKEWVLAMVKASADTVNYDIDMNVISKLIDDLCDMSNVVNPPAEKAGD